MAYMFLREVPIEFGRFPERLLFPRNLVKTKMIALAS